MKNKKRLYVFLFALLFFVLGFSVNSIKTYAVNLINSSSVFYDKTTSGGTKDNVKESIDELYKIADDYKEKCGDYGYVAEEINANNKAHVHKDSCYRIYYYYTTKVYDPCPGNGGYTDHSNTAGGNWQYTCDKCGAWVPSPGRAHDNPNPRTVKGEGYSLPSGASVTSTTKVLNCSIEYEGYECPSGYTLYQNNKCYRCPNGGTLYGKLCVLE